jgi:hypothetical protein
LFHFELRYPLEPREKDLVRGGDNIIEKYQSEKLRMLYAKS